MTNGNETMTTLEDQRPMISGMQKGQTLEQFITSWRRVPISENMSAMAERVIRFLQQTTPLRISTYYLAGSVGRSSCIYPSACDAIVLIVLNDFRCVQDMKTLTRGILHTIKSKMDSRSWHDGQVIFHDSSSEQSIRFETYFTGIGVHCIVDICPVYDALRNKTTTDLYKEMMHCSTEDREMYGVCLTGKQAEFLKLCPPKLRELMMLLKECFKKEGFVPYMTPNLAYFLDVLALNRWCKAFKPRHFSLSEWFEDIMGQLVDISSLNVIWEHEFNAASYWQLPLPIVLDPVNPFKNLMPPHDLHANIKTHARKVLRRMAILRQYLNMGLRTDKYLQQLLVETIEPDSDFRRTCLEVVEKMTLFLQHKTEFDVSMVIKGGSLGKSTNIKGKSDVDLVVYINSLATVQDLQRNMHYLLNTLERDLQANWRGKLELVRRTPYGLQYRLSCGETGHLHEVDILPACDILKDKTLDQVHDEMLNLSQQEREFYNVCFAKKQVEFVKQVPIKVKNLIRLVKYWAKMELNVASVKIVLSYFLESLVMYRWTEWGRPDDFNIHDGFKDVMLQLTEIYTMRVLWQDRYNESSLFNVDVMYPGGIPIFLDPQNPFRNLAPFDQNKSHVAVRAHSMLQTCENMEGCGTGNTTDLQLTSP